MSTVKVNKQFFIGSLLLAPKVYHNAPDVLVKFAADENNAAFAVVVEEEGSVAKITDSTPIDNQQSDLVNNVEDQDDDEPDFILPEDFKKKTSAEQIAYIESIREYPEGVAGNEEKEKEYNRILHDVVNAYRGVAKAKTEELIDEVLSEFEEV